MRMSEVRKLIYLFIFLLFSCFSLGSITWYPNTLTTGLVDTSASVNCTGGEVFLGNGTCLNIIDFFDYNHSWSESLANTLYAGISWAYNQTSAVFEDLRFSNFNSTEGIQLLINGSDLSLSTMSIGDTENIGNTDIVVVNGTAYLETDISNTASYPAMIVNVSGTAALNQGSILGLYSPRGAGTDDVDLMYVYGGTTKVFSVRNGEYIVIQGSAGGGVKSVYDDGSDIATAEFNANSLTTGRPRVIYLIGNDGNASIVNAGMQISPDVNDKDIFIMVMTSPSDDTDEQQVGWYIDYSEKKAQLFTLLNGMDSLNAPNLTLAPGDFDGSSGGALVADTLNNVVIPTGSLAIGLPSTNESIETSGYMKALGYIVSSDESIKDNITNVSFADDFIPIQGHSYNLKRLVPQYELQNVSGDINNKTTIEKEVFVGYKEEVEDKVSYGFIAGEVPVKCRTPEGYDPACLTRILWSKVEEQQNDIDNMQSEIDGMKQALCNLGVIKYC